MGTEHSARRASPFLTDCCGAAASLLALTGGLAAQVQGEQAPNERERAMQQEIEDLRRRADDLEHRLDQVETSAGDTPDAPIGGAGSLPTAGYDRGFFIQSEDGQFRLEFGAFTQFRYDVNMRMDPPPGEGETTNGFTIARTRIFMTGKFTDDWNFHLRTNIDDQGEVSLVNAWAQYNLQSGTTLRAGEIFVALSREDWQFALDVLGSDYSANDYTFGIGSSLGGQIHHQAEQVRGWLALSNGASGGKSNFTQPEVADWAVTGRGEWMFSGDDWSVWDDLIGRPGRADGWLLGLGAATQGGGENLPTAASLITADLSANGDGWQAMISPTIRHTTESADGTYYDYGVLVQGGYFFTQTSQVFAAYNYIGSHGRTSDPVPFNSVTLGYNWVPFDWTNKFKLTAEASYLFDPLSDTIVGFNPLVGWLPTDEGDQVLFRVQLQFGF